MGYSGSAPMAPGSLTQGKNLMIPYSFSPNGRRMAYSERSLETNMDLWTLPLDLSDPEHPKPGKPEPLLHTSASELYPAFSPDGRWMAYSSDELGRREIYLAAFDSTSASLAGKWRISTDGGENPMWSHDGHELFFTSPDNRIMVASVTPDGTSFVQNGKPVLWSTTQVRRPANATYLALHPDGKRFAVFPMPEAKEQQNASVHITLLNFFDELRRRAPEKK
jgi:eukaryotic-like serine/threonine-protein kinase